MDFGNLDLRVLAKRLARDVRAGLDAAGHLDVTFDEHWVRFEPAPLGGHDLSVLVPLGAVDRLPLEAWESRADGDPDWLLTQFAAELAKALPNARAATRMLTRYLSGVRSAAVKAVESARAAGADLQLDSVAIKPILAWNMTDDSWRDAAKYVLARVRVRCLDLALRLGVEQFVAEEAADVPAEIALRCEEQLERQARRADLRARGADLEVDGTTMRILAHFGLDAAGLLRRVEAEQLVQVAVQEDGRPGRLILIASGGRVGSTLDLEGQRHWTDGCLEVPPASIDRKHPPRPGFLVGPAAGHPLFRGLVVERFDELPDALVTLVHVRMPMLLFDGVSGMTWDERRLAA